MDKILLNYKIKLLNIKNSDIPNNINQKVSKIFVINLKDNKIRRNYILCLMKKYKINYTFVVVDRIKEEDYLYINKKNLLTKSECGCLLSHLWCLNEIIKNQYPNALVLEDDIILHKDFINKFDKIYSPVYDLLLLGACDFSFASLHKNRVKNGVYTITEESRKVYGAHANYYSLKGAMKMFDLKMNDLSFFDKDYYSMFAYFVNTSFICYPNLVVTDISTTNLNHKYEFFTQNEINYYSKCFTQFDFTQYNFIYLHIIQKNKDIKIQPQDTYESYMLKLIHTYFYNKKHETNIQHRLVMDFFTLNDLKKIMKNI